MSQSIPTSSSSTPTGQVQKLDPKLVAAVSVGAEGALGAIRPPITRPIVTLHTRDSDYSVAPIFLLDSSTGLTRKTLENLSLRDIDLSTRRNWTPYTLNNINLVNTKVTAAQLAQCPSIKDCIIDVATYCAILEYNRDSNNLKKLELANFRICLQTKVDVDQYQKAGCKLTIEPIGNYEVAAYAFTKGLAPRMAGKSVSEPSETVSLTHPDKTDSIPLLQLAILYSMNETPLNLSSYKVEIKTHADLRAYRFLREIVKVEFSKKRRNLSTISEYLPQVVLIDKGALGDDKKPDLSYFNLRFSNLQSIDLTNCKLEFADIRHASLSQDVTKIKQYPMAITQFNEPKPAEPTTTKSPDSGMWGLIKRSVKSLRDRESGQAEKKANKDLNSGYLDPAGIEVLRKKHPSLSIYSLQSIQQMDQAQINSECKVKITSVAELNKWAVFKSRHQLTNPIDFTGFRMPSEGTTASQDEKKALNKAVDSLVSLGLLKNLSLTEQDKTTINLSPACRRMIIKYATNQSISFSDVLNAYAEASLITQKILKCPNFRVQLPTDDELNSLESKLSDDQNQKTKRTPNLTPILQGTFIPFYLPSTKKDTLSIKKVARIANLECHPTTLRLLRYAANPSNLAECELQNKNPVAELEKFAETVPEHSLKSMPTSTKTEAKTSGLPNSKKYNASIHQGLSDAVILLTRFDEMHRVCNQLGSQAEELEWKIDPQKTELKDLQDAQEAKQTQYEKDRSKWEGELAAAENELSRYAGNEVIGTPEGGSYRRALHHPTDLDSMKTTIIAQNKRVWVGEVGENCSEGFEVYAKYELLKGMEPKRPEPVSTTEIDQSIATQQTDLDSIREQQKKMLDDFVTQYHAIKKQLKDIPSTELKQFLDKLDRCMQRLKPVAEQIPENKRPELVKKLFFKTEVAKQGRLSRWIESLRSAPPPIYASNLLKEANELHTKWLKKTQFIGVTETGSLTKIVYANGGLNTHLFRYPLACSIPSGVNFAETCSNLTSLERTIDRLNASIQSEENEIASLEVSITSISKKFITAAKDNAKTDAQNVKADILSYFGISDEDAKFITTDDNKTHSVRDIYEAFKLRATVSRYQEWPLLFKAMYVLEESKSTNDTWDVNTLALATLEAFPSRSIADMTDALVAESRAETSVAILFYKGIANQADRETLEIAKLPNVAIQESTNVARQDQPDSPTQAQEDMKKVLEEYFPTDKSEEPGKLHHLNRKTTAELHAVKAKLESGRKYVRLGSKEFKQYVELMGKLDMQIAKSDCLLEYYVVSGNRSTESGGILKSLESIAGKHQTAAQPNSLDDLCADHLKIVLESYKNLFEKVGGLDTEATYDELLLIQSELTRMETIILKKYRHVTENNLKSDTFQQMQSAKQVVNARIELVKLNEEQQLTVNRLFEQYPKAESNMVQDGLNFIGNAFWQDSPPPPLPKIGGPKVSDSQSTGAFNTGETQSSDSSSGLLWFGSIWGGISTALGQYTGQHNMAKWQDSTIKSGELAKELDTYMTRYSDRVTLSQILDALVELKIDKTSLSLEKSKAEHSAVEENLKLFYHLKGKNSSITYAAVKAMPKVKPKASYQVDSTKIPTQSATQTSESATDAVSKLTPPSQELKTMTQFALEYVEAWKGSINGRQWSDTESNQLIPLKNYLDSLPDTAQLQEQDPEYAKCIGRLRIQLCTTTSNRGTYSQARLEHMITQLQVQHYKDYKREVLQYLSSLARNYSEVNPTVLEKEVDAQWEVYKDLVKTNSWTGKSKSEEDFKEEYRNFITNSSAQIDAFVKKEEKKTINTIDDSKLFEEGLNKFLGRALLLEPVPGQDQGATRRANQYDYERDGTTARIMRHLRNDHREFIGSVFEAEHGKSIRSRFPQLNIRRLKPTPPQAGWVSRGLDFLVSHRPGQHTPGAYGSGFEPRQPERGSYPPGSTQPTGNGSRSVANNIADSQSTQGFTALLTTVLNQLKDLKSRRGRRGWSDEDYKNLKALGAHLSTEPNNVLTVHEKYLLGEIRKEIEWDGKPIYTKKIDKQAFFEDFTQLSKEFTSLTQAGLIDKKQQ